MNRCESFWVAIHVLVNWYVVNSFFYVHNTISSNEFDWIWYLNLKMSLFSKISLDINKENLELWKKNLRLIWDMNEDRTEF